MAIDRDINFNIDEKAIYIDGAFGFCDFDSKYKIFKGEELINLIRFISRCRSTQLGDNLPEEITKEINGRYVSFINNQENIADIIDSQKIAGNDILEGKEFIFRHENLIIKSFSF